MCRAFVLFKLSNEKDKNLYGVLLNYIQNSYETGNRDGFFFTSNTVKSIRTLDYKKYIDYIIKNKEKIETSKILLGHLRMASNGGVTEKWIHGWKINNWYCCHNGILHFNNVKEEYENDSFTFFNHVANRKLSKTLKNIKKFSENHVSGSGVLIMSDLQRYTIIIAVNKGANIHLINDKIIAINSNDDIHKFKNKIIMKEEKTIDFGKIAFTETKRKMLDVEIDIEKDLKTEIENEIVVFDSKKNEFTVREEVETKYQGIGRRWNFSW